MKKASLYKNPRKIGEISRHQWGVVVDRGGLSIAICSHSSVDKPMVVKKWKSEQSSSEK